MGGLLRGIEAEEDSHPSGHQQGKGNDIRTNQDRPFHHLVDHVRAADAEENTGKVKAVVPESEDDIEIDETIEDDDDDDSTFIPDEEEGDEDVTDIIGDVGGDEET